jgi:hypothetical protein
MAILNSTLVKLRSTDIQISPVRRTWDISQLPLITRATLDTANFQYIEDLSSTAISYARKVAKQPKFDFMITNEDDDFYINTHGVSVVTNKSFTDLSNGRFYILNKNNVPIYFNLIEIENISLRDDNLNKIRIDKIDTISDNNYIFDVYIIKINENEVGELEISRLIRFENNKNEIVNPQQSIEFRATYNVLNIGNFNIQYFGKNNKTPNKKRGVIDIDLKVKCFGDKNLTREITDSVRISLNMINNSDFIINSSTGLALSTAQQFLKYNFLKPPTTLGQFTIQKNGANVRTSTEQINSATDISILPGDIMTVTINPTAITGLTSNIVLIENGVIAQQVISTGLTTCTFNVLGNRTYEINAYLDFIPIAPVVRYRFNTNNRIGIFRVFKNNTLLPIVETNLLVNNYVNIPGLGIGDSIVARVEPNFRTTSSLSINNTSLNSQLYGQSTAAGVVNQSNPFILQSGGVFEIDATLSPAPIRIYYRHENVSVWIERSTIPLYTNGVVSPGVTVLGNTLLAGTFNVNEVFRVGSRSVLNDTITINVTRYDGSNYYPVTTLTLPSVFNGGSPVSPQYTTDFSLIAGNDYFIVLYQGDSFDPLVPVGGGGVGGS